MLKDTSGSSSESQWYLLYEILPAIVMRAVYALRISLWYGQEKDVVEDIVQETLVRLWERTCKAERGEASPIGQLERMAVVVAYNCCRDMRRRDRRLCHFPSSIAEFEDRYLDASRLQRDYSEDATERVFLDALFSLLAQEVVRFPQKQRRALLTELANTMCFEERPSTLQQAFLTVGVDLREYQQDVTTTFKARSQHNALLYWAYKRMNTLPPIQEYLN